MPDAIHHVSENNGEGAPSDTRPIDVDSSDELGEVGRAFNQMRSEMLRLAANEAALRGRLDAMFVNLSHRSQSLVERQIRLIDHLEQGELDSERLANLLKMNRIASRMHRNSQNLLVLAGHEIPSDWNQPIALVNVVRAAVSEVEDYERVSLTAQPDIAVRGPAVNDVVHLLAELIENATSFSAGDMQVDISGRVLTSGGILIDITDRGVGMAPKELAQANWRLEHPPTADINVPKWMGMFVVARLAARHGIRVRLQQADFGGLTALTWLPGELLTDQGAVPPSRLSSFGSAGSRRRLPEPGLPETATDPGYAAAEQRVTASRSPQFVPAREDVPPAPLGRRSIPEAGRLPGSTASGPRPTFHPRPPATVGPSGPGLSDSAGERVGVSGQQAPARGDEDPSAGTFAAAPLSGLAPQWRSETSQSASAPVANQAPAGQEKSAQSAVIIPPVEAPAETRRLPIYDSVRVELVQRSSRGVRQLLRSYRHGRKPLVLTGRRRLECRGDGRFAVLGRRDVSGAPETAAERQSGPRRHPGHGTRLAEPVSCRGQGPARRIPATCGRGQGRGRRTGKSWGRRRVLTGPWVQPLQWQFAVLVT